MNKDEQDIQDGIPVRPGRLALAGALIIAIPPLAAQGVGPTDRHAVGCSGED